MENTPSLDAAIRDLAPSLDQIEDATSELRRATTPSHAVLLQDSSIRGHLRDPTKAPADRPLSGAAIWAQSVGRSIGPKPAQVRSTVTGYIVRR
jgi:hypothetical protein